MFDKKAWSRQYNQIARVRQANRERMQKYIHAHPDRIIENQRKFFTLLMRKERHFLQRMGILIHYSNPPTMPICNNCGEQDFDALCLDHINGGGGKHRKELNSGSIHYWTWLEKNDFPEGYQVLCANCNQRKLRIDRGYLKLDKAKLV